MDHAPEEPHRALNRAPGYGVLLQSLEVQQNFLLRKERMRSRAFWGSRAVEGSVDLSNMFAPLFAESH